MLTAYLILAAWFLVIDVLAGRIAGSPTRPIATVALALLWPLSMAFALLASAAIVTHYRKQLAAQPEPPR